MKCREQTVALHSVLMVYIGIFILYLHTGQVIVGRHSVVGTVTCYGLDSPGIETQGRQPNQCDIGPIS